MHTLYHCCVLAVIFACIIAHSAVRHGVSEGFGFCEANAAQLQQFLCWKTVLHVNSVYSRLLTTCKAHQENFHWTRFLLTRKHTVHLDRVVLDYFTSVHSQWHWDWNMASIILWTWCAFVPCVLYVNSSDTLIPWAAQCIYIQHVLSWSPCITAARWSLQRIRRVGTENMTRSSAFNHSLAWGLGLGTAVQDIMLQCQLQCIAIHMLHSVIL